MNATACRYHHTQGGPWFAVLYGLSALFLLLAIFLPDFPPRFVFFAVGILLTLLASGVHYLTVEDSQKDLLVHFGPVPLFRKRIAYRDIVSVEVGRTTWLDGWGIHWSLRGGWVWNIWGRDCVIIGCSNQLFFVGTNEPQRLLDHLKGRLATLDGRSDLLVH